MTNSERPTHSDDRRPRYYKGKGQDKNGDPAALFWHPCKICGLVNASFGVNVGIPSDSLGDWYCFPHLPPRKTAS